MKTIVAALISATIVASVVNTPTTTFVTVDGIDYPVCAVEDCSDQVGQVGVWINSKGQHWLSVGERSYLVHP